ncbi:unnamed protein product, partial [Sphacelaria rigidula]
SISDEALPSVGTETSPTHGRSHPSHEDTSIVCSSPGKQSVTQDESSPNSPTLAPLIDAGLNSTALPTPRLDESSPKPPMLALTSDSIELIGVSNSTPRPDESSP